MATLDDALAKLHAHAHPDQLAGMAKFGIVGDQRLGLPVPEMRQIARELKLTHKDYIDVRLHYRDHLDVLKDS